MQRTRAVAFIWQDGYGADADKRDLIEALKDGADAAARLSPRSRWPETDPAPVLGASAGDAATSRDGKTDPNQIVYLAFTSGTTGKPKGVMHSDNTLLANARQLAKDWSIDDGLGDLFALARSATTSASSARR